MNIDSLTFIREAQIKLAKENCEVVLMLGIEKYTRKPKIVVAVDVHKTKEEIIEHLEQHIKYFKENPNCILKDIG